MVDCRLCLIIFAAGLCIIAANGERARHDRLQPGEEREDDVVAENGNDQGDDFIETIKRFLTSKKKTTSTVKPSSGAIAALLTTTQATSSRSTSTKSSGIFGSGSTSRFDRTKATSAPTKDACGAINPCKNAGTCKTLSSGRFYCFCSQDFYGKNCENKFISTGAANNDRAAKDHCASSPCKNNGECVGLRTTFYCRCKSPYYGMSCDKKIGKREEIVDEQVDSDAEEGLHAYEHNLEEDRDDLRRALASEDNE